MKVDRFDDADRSIADEHIQTAKSILSHSREFNRSRLIADVTLDNLQLVSESLLAVN
jgi:hypothetical protein